MKNVLQISVFADGSCLARAWFTDWEDAMDYALPYLKDIDSDFGVEFRWCGLEVIPL